MYVRSVLGAMSISLAICSVPWPATIRRSARHAGKQLHRQLRARGHRGLRPAKRANLHPGPARTAGDYLPASIQSVPLAAGGTGLRIQFAAPSPLGLLRPLTSQP
jgi:hypothetical protein